MGHSEKFGIYEGICAFRYNLEFLQHQILHLFCYLSVTLLQYVYNTFSFPLDGHSNVIQRG
jgi:hypothetical protein